MPPADPPPFDPLGSVAMASFLLVHGSWHGAWCWERLVPLLESDGHEVTAIDLPAHGEDRSSPYLATLNSYGRRVAEAAGEFARQPFVVGHSMGGFAITQAAASRPDAFAGLVYLCAFVPQPGDSLIALGRQDPDTLVPRGLHRGAPPDRWPARETCSRLTVGLAPSTFSPVPDPSTTRHPTACTPHRSSSASPRGRTYRCRACAR